MANEFYIEPAGNFMKGLSGIGDALENRWAVMKDKAMRQGAMDVLKNGNADEIADYIAKHPGADKVMDSVVGFRNEMTKKNMADTSINALTGPPENIAQTLLDRAEFVKSHGGDYKGTLALAQLAMKDPEQAIPLLERGLAVADPKLYQSYYMSVYGKDGGASGHKLGQSQVVEKDGKQYFAAFVLGPDGKGRTELTPIDGAITKGGETPGKRRLEDLRYKIKEAELTGNIDLANKLKVEVAKTEQELKRVEGGEIIKGAAETNKQAIERGISAAQSIPSIRDSLRLLDTVKTGGFYNVKNKIENIFGITGADEGELTYNMGKGVVTQLKSIFGGNMSAKEGEWLKEIETSFGKNAAVNKRILKKALSRLIAESNIGERAAIDSNNKVALSQIREYRGMGFVNEEHKSIKNQKLEEIPKVKNNLSTESKKKPKPQKDLSKHSNEDLLNILNGGK